MTLTNVNMSTSGKNANKVMLTSIRSKVTSAMLIDNACPMGSAVQVTNSVMWATSSRRRLMASPGEEPAGRGVAPGRCKIRRSKLCCMSVPAISMKLFSAAQAQIKMLRLREMPIKAAAMLQIAARASASCAAVFKVSRVASNSNKWRIKMPGNNGQM